MASRKSKDPKVPDEFSFANATPLQVLRSDGTEMPAEYNQYEKVEEGAKAIIEWQNKLGQALAAELMPEASGLFFLQDFPTHYHLRWYQAKEDKKNQAKHYYLFGYPEDVGFSKARKYYRSPNQFLPHLIWLLGDSRDRGDCSCEFCLGAKPLAARTPKFKISTSNQQGAASTPASTTGSTTPSSTSSSAKSTNIVVEVASPKHKAASVVPTATSMPASHSPATAQQHTATEGQRAMTSTPQFAPPVVQGVSTPAQQYASPAAQGVGAPAQQYAPPAAQGVGAPSQQYAPPAAQGVGAHSQQYAQPAAQRGGPPTHQFASPAAQGVGAPAHQYAPPVAQGVGTPVQQFASPGTHGAVVPAQQYASHGVQGAMASTQQFASPMVQGAMAYQQQPETSSGAHMRPYMPRDHDALFRAGEVVWYKNNNSWRVGMILVSSTALSIIPFSHPLYPTQVIYKEEVDVRPFLAFSIPQINTALQEFKGRALAQIDWHSLQERFGTLTDPARQEGLAIEATKLAATRVDQAYSTFNLISSEPNYSVYGGVFLGAEKICIGEAVRIHLSREQRDQVVQKDMPVVMVIKRIIIMDMGETGNLVFEGSLWKLQHAKLTQQQHTASLAQLPASMLGEKRFRDSILQNRGWCVEWIPMIETLSVNEQAIRGRFYETQRLTPILNPAKFQEMLRQQTVDDIQTLLNNRADAGGPRVGRVRNRAQAVIGAVPNNILTTLNLEVMEE